MFDDSEALARKIARRPQMMATRIVRMTAEIARHEAALAHYAGANRFALYTAAHTEALALATAALSAANVAKPIPADTVAHEAALAAASDYEGFLLANAAANHALSGFAR